MNVIRTLGVCVVVSICVCLSACAAKGTVGKPTTVPTTSSASTTQPTTTQTTAGEDEKRIYEQDDNYVVYIYKDDNDLSNFRCVIFDDNHNELEYEDFGLRNFDIEQKENEVILSYISMGPLVNRRYYDVKRGRASVKYLNPICENKDKVAYYAFIDGKDYVVVQDKYDRAVYYKRFQRDFSSAFAYVNANASFSADGKSLTTSYPTMEGGKEIQKTETFPLY